MRTGHKDLDWLSAAFAAMARDERTPSSPLTGAFAWVECGDGSCVYVDSNAGDASVVNKSLDDFADPVLVHGRRMFAITGGQGHLIAGAFRLMLRERRLASDRIAQLEAEAAKVQTLEAEVNALKERVALANKWRFGASSERGAVPPATDAPQDATDQTAVPVSGSAAESAGRKFKVIQGGRAGRKPLPESLERVRHEYDLAGEARNCPKCKREMTEIGADESELLRVIPAQYCVDVFVRKKYVCRCCGLHCTAPGPEGNFPGSSYGSPSIVANTLALKFWMGMPLYRQALMLNRRGIPASRTTLANLTIGASDLLTSVVAAFRSDLLRQDIIHSDDTSVQVLDEPNRAPQTLSTLWTYRSGQLAEHPVVIFEYQQTKGGKHPKRFLTREDGTEFDGYLHVDGYAGYNVLEAPTRVGCWAHTRRYFVDALVNIPEEKQASSPAGQAVQLINELYAVEHEAQGLSPKERKNLRKKKAAPVLRKLRSWLDEHRAKTARKSLLGKAIGYATKEWDHLSVYLEDGRIDIDNNHCERAIKHVVIGRKNWLFSESPAGAVANATNYSVVLTAMANGLDPEWYLTELLKRLPQMRRADEVQTLMPWSALMKDAWESANLPVPNAA